VWLNDANEWIYPHLQIAQTRMSDLARKFTQPTAVQLRALNQAARELMLAQSSDWPFILRTRTSPEYATRRVKEHLLRFMSLHKQLIGKTIDEPALSNIEWMDNIFPDVNYHYWA
jgi:1,4-alpha-glucan branching enzyme